MSELLGKTLGDNYRMDQLVATGGMGTVYKARDLSLERDVAIKVMHAHFTSDPDFRARFLQEARAIAALDHPGIVRIYAFGQDLERLYIVMDLISGQTLHDWLVRLAEEAKIVALTESLAIAYHVARALHYAHEEGVLHRDVKPGNILLKPVSPALREPDDLPFRPVLTDFGLAKLAEGGVHTRTGTTMGTPAYMSPEQCLGLEPDRRSDIYSLGIVLFELTAGRVPFEVKSLTEAIRCHTQEPPPPPRSINPTLPVEVENIVLRALAKRQEDRYPTAREMAAALKGAQSSVPADLSILPVQGPVGSHTDEQTPYVSLMTRLALEQADMPRPLARSLPSAEGILVVVSPEGQRQRVVLREGRAMVIGRGANADVCLDDPQVSRHHVRVECNGGRVTIVDLDSTNGTFLGDSRLLPRIAEVWTQDRPLRVGGTVIHLELAHGHGDVIRAASADETVARLAAPAREEQRIGISIETFDLSVEPGSSVTVSFTILNQGSVVDHFETSIQGVPADWTPSLPPVVRLLPGEEHDIALTVHPPRSPQSRAGLYPVTVRVTSQDAPDQVAEVKGTLNIIAYYQFDLALRPQKGTGISKGDYHVRLGNQGNADLTVELQAIDSEDGCWYVFDPPQAILCPGQERPVSFEVQPKTPLPGGAERTISFTVTARPREAPELVRSAQGQWVQIAPAYQVSLRPQRQSGTEKGMFEVRLVNQCAADLDLQLEAMDPEDACLYAFEPSQVTVHAGQERVVQLELRPKLPLPGEAARAYSFTVTARPVGAPGSARQVQGQWVHIPPAFEISLHPGKASGIDVGTYGVQVQNQSIAQLAVELGAADPKNACTYAFERSEIAVPASQDRTVQLEVRPRQLLRGKESQSHVFTVTARASAAPRSVRQAQAEWVQLPRTRSLWAPALLTIGGWIVAWIVFWALGYEAFVDVAIEGIKSVIGHGNWDLAFLIVWAFRGAMAGLIGGAVMGLALRWAEPSFGWGQGVGVTIAWGLAWAIGVTSAPLTGIPFSEGIAPMLFWAVVGALVGLVGGVFTAMALRPAVPSLGGEHVLGIALGWAVAWAVGELVVEWVVHSGEYWIWEASVLPPWVLLGLILGGIGGVIGSTVMFGLLGLPSRRDAVPARL